MNKENFDEILACEHKPLKEGYAVQNIDEKNQKVIEALRTGLKDNIEKCLKEIDSLKSAVSLYRDSITDYVDLSIEKSDIVAKYSKANNSTWNGFETMSSDMIVSGGQEVSEDELNGSDEFDFNDVDDDEENKDE